MKVIILSAFFSLLVCAQEIAFMTENTPPYSYEVEGEVKGIFVDIVKAMQKEMKHPYNTEILPWKRAYYKMTNLSGQMALYATMRTPAREDLFKWVCPLSDKSTYFFKKRGSSVHIRTIEDAKKVGYIGVINGWSEQEQLKKMGFANLVSTQSVFSSYTNLMKGRLDLIPASPGAIKKSANQYGINPEAFENTGVLLNRTDICIAFTKAVPDSEIRKWQKALEKVNASPLRQEIFGRYLPKLNN